MNITQNNSPRQSGSREKQLLNKLQHIASLEVREQDRLPELSRTAPVSSPPKPASEQLKMAIEMSQRIKM